MDALVQFSLPVKGLRYGVYEYNFHIDRSFFACFEASPVEDGELDVHLRFDKQPGMFVLQLDINGRVVTECDRCLASIRLPISDQRKFVVKFSTEAEMDDDDVVYIHPDTQKFDVAPYIYEYVVLAIPIVKTYDCENDPSVECNWAFVEQYMAKQKETQALPADEESREALTGNNALWEALKQWNQDNNN